MNERSKILLYNLREIIQPLIREVDQEILSILSNSAKT